MNTTWTIQTLWVKPLEAELENIVIGASWSCTGTEQSGGNTYKTSINNTCSFSPPDPANFIRYENLTLADVLNWVYASGVDKQATEEAVANKISNQINPPVITPPLPWESND